MLVALIAASPGVPAFLGAWSFDPVPALGILVASVVYGVAFWGARRAGRGLPGRYALWFGLGLLALALALLSPLASYDDISLSLHMIQHLLLLTVAPPLLLLGRPVQVMLNALPPGRSGVLVRLRSVRRVLTTLTHPVVALLLFGGCLVLWHIPDFYDVTLTNEHLHDLEHLTFVVTSMLYWWTVVDPIPRHRKLPLSVALGSIFLASLVSVGVGAVLTVARQPVYTPYLSTPHLWGLSPLEDQQLAGSIMWAGGGLIYMGIIFGMIVHALGWEQGGADDADSLPTAEHATADVQ